LVQHFVSSPGRARYFVRRNGAHTNAAAHWHTSASASGIPPCAGAGGPLTPNSQLSHQDCNKRAPARPQGGSCEMAEPARAKPKPTPETQHFWDGTKAGELRLQRCDECSNVYFPPRPFCPACASRKVSVFKASGKGKLYSYVI